MLYRGHTVLGTGGMVGVVGQPEDQEASEENKKLPAMPWLLCSGLSRICIYPTNSRLSVRSIRETAICRID